MLRKPTKYSTLRSSNIVEEVNNEEPFRPRPRRKRRKTNATEDPSSGTENDGHSYNICPCTKCGEKYKPTVRSASVIARHIEEHNLCGRYEALYRAGLSEGPQRVSSPNPQTTQHVPREDVLQEDPMDYEDIPENPDVVVADFLLDRFGIEVQPLHEEVPNIQEDEMNCLAKEASTPLYTGCRSNRLSIILQFLKVQARHTVSNVCIDEIFEIIADHIIDSNLESKMPKTRAEARKVITELGLDYKTIHSCPCDGILYFKENEDLQRCLKCNLSRYRQDTLSKSVPRKKMHYFPITPRLQAMFRCPSISKMMTWHHDHKSEDDIMRGPADSPAWKFALTRWEFLQNPRNVFLGMAMDGVNPFGNNSSAYSIWPIVLTCYNLPPWLAIKASFLILAAIIPGKRKVKDMNVYLAPIVDELNELWTTGAESFDVNTKELFIMKAILMWTMHDYPGYGVASSLQTQGFFGCPVCGPEHVNSYSAKELDKIIYHGYRRYLPEGHPWRLNEFASQFNGKVEPTSKPPSRMDGWDWFVQWEKIETRSLQLQKSGMTGLSKLYDLEYWVDLKIQHLLDPMHIEKNVCSSLFKTLTNAKGTKADSEAQRFQMKNMGIMKDMWIESGNAPPLAPWIFTKIEFAQVIDVLQTTTTPKNYGSSFEYKFVDNKITGMKTHDYHNLLHDLLPIAVRDALNEKLRSIVYRLGEVFRWICGKEINISEIPGMKTVAAELMCDMEKNLPPSFFDIQVHLIWHLVEEVELCGPVSALWMYFLERYMKDLKSWVRQKARPEGSMAEGYILSEAMHYTTEYTTRLAPNAPQLWRLKEDPCLSETVLPKAYKMRCLDRDAMGRLFLEQVHNFVLKNDPCMSQWRRRYALEVTNNEVDFGEWALSQMRTQISLGERPPDREYDIVLGPHPKVKFFAHMWAGGKYLRVAARDVGKKTQDSGIACSFHDLDDNGEPCTVEYYGKIRNIIQVKFTSFTTILLKGDWYDSKPTSRGNPRVLVDECKFTRVRTSNFMPSHLVVHEPFVYPLDVDQVFFIVDKLNRGWHLVVKYEARSKKILYKREVDLVCQEDEENVSTGDDDNTTSVQANQFRHMENRGDLISMEFIDEEPEEFTDDSGEEGTFRQESNYVESSSRLEPIDVDSIDFDVHGKEPVQVANLRPRIRFERYIGEHLIGEENLSYSELEDAHVLPDVIGYSGSDRE